MICNYFGKRRGGFFLAESKTISTYGKIEQLTNQILLEAYVYLTKGHNGFHRGLKDPLCELRESFVDLCGLNKNDSRTRKTLSAYYTIR